MADLAPGSVVAGCRIESVAGQGGMGVVYRATQLSLERPVALKAIAAELAGDVTFRERFKRESRIAASIEHPNVIPVYEAGEGDGLLYLIMRYVEGTDLRALIDAEGGLGPVRATRIVAQVAAALAAAHRRGLVHRDVKPANVLIDAGGERDHAYLTDFGIARDATATSNLTRTGAVIGTLDYLPPERIQDAGGDGRSDIYALGCVLYEALTGRVPFPRENEVAKMFAHLNAPVPSAREIVPNLREELDELAARAMAKDPDDRFGGAGEMAEALIELLPARTTPLPASKETSPSPPAPGVPADLEPTVPAPARPEPPPTPPPTAPAVRDTSREAAPEAETGEELGVRGGAAPVPLEGTTVAASAPPAAPKRRGRPALIVSIGAGAAAGAVVLALALSGGDEKPREETAANTTTREQTETREEPRPAERLAFKSAGRTQIAPGADGMATADGTLWIANKDANQLIPVDEASAEAGPPIAVGQEPDSVAIGFDSLWVTNTTDNTVTRIGLASRTPVGDPIQVGTGPEGIAVSDDAVWVANGREDTISRIPAGRGAPTQTVVGAGPVQLAVTGDDRVWVTLSKANQVVELDADTGEPIEGQVAEITGQPRGIAFDGERLWVSATSADRLVSFDPDRPGRVRPFKAPDDPREVRFGLGAVWVTSGNRGTLTAFDPANGKRVRSFRVGRLTYGAAVSDRFAWAASEVDGELRKVAPAE